MPFVTYSGFGGADLESECSEVYISKPRPPEFIVAVVENLLKFGPSAAIAPRNWDGVTS